MRSRSCNFQEKSGSRARRVAPGPSLNRLKSKKSTCVPLKTLKLKVLLEEGTKLISIAKLHLEVLRAVKVKPKNLPPAAGVTDSLRSPKNVPAPSMKHPGYGPEVGGTQSGFFIQVH